MEKQKSKMEEKMSKIGTKKKIKMPDGSMMTQEEMDEKFGEMTPNTKGYRDFRKKKMPTILTGKRG